MAKNERLEGTNLVARNLQWLMHQEQITQQALAEATGVGQPTINKVLTGTIVQPRDTTLQPLAKYFQVTVDALRNYDLSQIFGLPSTLRGIKIPLISSRIAGMKTIPADWPDRITVYRKVSKDAFAMDVGDDGMEPNLHKQDRVIVEPNILPEPGDYVAFRVDDVDHSMIRRYKALESTGDHKAKREYELRPQNEFFRSYFSSKTKIYWIGVCVERHESLRN